MREFWNRGFHETSVDDLVAATGVQPGSLYNAFKGGKRELPVPRGAATTVFERSF